MLPTKEQLEEFYCKQGLTQQEIAVKFGSSQTRISDLMKKHGIKNNKRWTAEEAEYLERYYGIYSLQVIGKKLGKSAQAVESKARKIGLSCLMNSGKLTSKELAGAFQIDGHVVIDNWIKKRGLKASLKVVKSVRKYWRIDLDKFWEWAHENREIINFAKLEKNILGAEPEWVEPERRKDFREIPKKQGCKWTEEENKKLAMLWNSTNYTAKQIGEMLGKSEGGVRRRRRRLGLKNRKILIKWRPEEEELIINMKLKGALDKEIAWELGRDEEDVAWKRKKLIEQGKLNWKYREKAVEG